MRRFSLLLVVALAAPATFGCSRAPEASSPESALHALTVEQVATRIAAHDGKTFVYDDNPKDVYDAGHVPGAKWLDSDNVTAAALPADHSATLIFYCHSEA